MGDPDYLASTATLECGGGTKGERSEGWKGRKEGGEERRKGGREREERKKGANIVCSNGTYFRRVSSIRWMHQSYYHSPHHP